MHKNQIQIFCKTAGKSHRGIIHLPLRDIYSKILPLTDNLRTGDGGITKRRKEKKLKYDTQGELITEFEACRVHLSTLKAHCLPSVNPARLFDSQPSDVIPAFIFLLFSLCGCCFINCGGRK
ncbi:hypothetical protein CEXT_690511 [Caerostris extrusa]|uniref:Uncharacterized protein n=1 Tax=Caerostris extrusa TaxID=172846 RepID=A0AAV4MM84_CAEEX|nr:hypothetical protein CEXT_690511 [Caerostris extrusa]